MKKNKNKGKSKKNKHRSLSKIDKYLKNKVQLNHNTSMKAQLKDFLNLIYRIKLQLT